MGNLKARFLRTTIGSAMYARFVVPHYHAFVRIDGGEEQRVMLSDSDLSSEFVADPFLFNYNGDNWRFFEGMPKRQKYRGASKGVIACFRETGGEWRYQGVVLEEEHHLSYPHVFALDGSVYMIPETAQACEVALYRSGRFPFGWEKVAVLLRGKYVDSTVVARNGMFYMFATPEASSCDPELWYSDSLFKSWRRHPMSASVSRSPYLRRNGGAIYEKDGQLFRIVQDCNGGYGRRLFCIPIVKLTPDSYGEGDPNLLADEIGWRQNGLHHTYDRIWSNQHLIEVVDRHYNTFKSPLAFVEAAMWYVVDGSRYVVRGFLEKKVACCCV